MEAIKLGLKKRKKKGYYNSAMKTEKKNSKEPKSALMWRKIVFLIHILNLYNP